MKQLFIGMNTDEHYWKDAMKPDDLNPHKKFKREDVQHRESSFDWCLLQHQHIGFNIALILSMMRFYLLQLCSIFGFLIFQCQAYQQHHQQSKDFTFTYFN
jgi:hypothetical protein